MKPIVLEHKILECLRNSYGQNIKVDKIIPYGAHTWVVLYEHFYTSTMGAKALVYTKRAAVYQQTDDKQLRETSNIIVDTTREPV